MPIRHVEHRQTQSVPVKIWTTDFDQASLDQLVNIASLSFIHRHVAAMPDVHKGKGATVGSVIPTKKAIIPAAVGVDIGCGMCAVQLSIFAKDLPDNLDAIYDEIVAKIPLGAGGAHRESFGDPTEIMSRMPLSVDRVIETFGGRNMLLTAHQQMGTLGSGNHFIEICLDQNDQVWIMLHSGSRGIGNKIGTFYIEQAKEYCERHFIKLPDHDLAYLVEQTNLFEAYWSALKWAQDYAAANRMVMMGVVNAVLAKHLPPFSFVGKAVNCHHNYAELENHYGQNVYVTRKGAIRAREDDLGIIPGSMGSRSYIVRGKGNPESFCSCSHGAGRKLSRAKAKSQFTVEDLRKQTEGILCRKDIGVLDEIPGAYKNIETAMAHQTDLVDVLYELRQIINIKG